MNYARRRGIESANLKSVRPQLVRSINISSHVSHHQRHRNEVHPADFRLGAKRVGTIIRVVVHAVERAVTERVVHSGAVDVIVVVMSKAPAFVLL